VGRKEISGKRPELHYYITEFGCNTSIGQALYEKMVGWVEFMGYFTNILTFSLYNVEW
jgi:hypothetical protein